MPKIYVWVKLDNGVNPTRVAIDQEDVVDDLCNLLKDIKFKTELTDIGRTQLDVKSPDDSHVSYGRDKIIKDLPATTADQPILIGFLQASSHAASYDSRPELNFLTTPSSQNSASIISNDSVALLGFGSLPTSFRIDATDESVVSSALCPTDTDIQKVSEDMPLLGELLDLIPREEEDFRGLNFAIGHSGSLFQSVVNGMTTLKSIDCGMGLATPVSYCDHLFMKDEGGVPSGPIELKGGEYSPLQGNRQAAVYGSHLAMGLLKLGLAPERIIVPLCTYTGMLIQFGVTIVLKPSFPVYWTISKILDLADANERRLAVAHIQKANAWINQLSIPPFVGPTTHFVMKLDASAYHIKTLTDSVRKRGFQLFSNLRDDISQGIEHWGRVLNLLYADRNIRPHVAFPLAIRSPNTSDDEKEYMIIYKDLCAVGYQSGCPDRVNEPLLYDSFRNEVRRIINLVHRAGVIHCDLYLSNIMWRKSAISDSENRVDIVIIDWDCAHCLIEGRFHIKVQEAFRKSTRGATFGTAFDDLYVDVLFREYDEGEKEYWTDLASGIKSQIDTEFYTLFDRMNASTR